MTPEQLKQARIPVLLERHAALVQLNDKFDASREALAQQFKADNRALTIRWNALLAEGIKGSDVTKQMADLKAERDSRDHKYRRDDTILSMQRNDRLRDLDEEYDAKLAAVDTRSQKEPK